MMCIELTVLIIILAVIVLFMFYMAIFYLVRRHYPTSMPLELMDLHNYTACECDLINADLADITRDWTDEEIDAVSTQTDLFLGNIENLKEIIKQQNENENKSK